MKKFIIFIICLLFINTTFGEPVIKLIDEGQGSYTSVLDHVIHEDYGCKYPVTYEFSCSGLDSSASLNVKYLKASDWNVVPLRSRADKFNAVDAVRLDIENSKIFVSVAFSEESDSIYFEFLNTTDIEFLNTCKYYDNRKAAIICSLDDVASWFRPASPITGGVFQSYNLWLTMGFITGGLDNHYPEYQAVIDNGLIEIGSHSRSHPNGFSDNGYGDNLESELSGNKSDLINNFNMPELFRYKDKEYIYTWIAPHGYRDAKVDSLLAQEKYLINRLYGAGFNEVSPWDSYNGMFVPAGMSGEIGHTSWSSSAITDTVALDARFDTVYDAEGVYHVMLHPQSIDWDQRYGHHHLEYLSGREDIWYVAVGHLYLYELLANTNYEITSVEFVENKVPTEIHLNQNYPNPFNPTTTINYALTSQTDVKLSIYNIQGQLVETLVNENQNAGNYRVIWNAANHSSGIYFYRLTAGSKQIMKQCVLMK